jgi:glycosyltransferase involved in cell wall biosynthesis/UDP-2,3-diacylglucosamine pyrophosphatase LpxH
MRPRIANITGTFGTEVQNGVGRFLSGLHEWSQAHDYPLRVFTSGEHVRRYPEVKNIHALAFPIPGGFHAIEAYYPLEGRRKQMRRAVKAFDPEVVHISTPDALGLTGLRIARRLKRPVAGIYHSDFPSYVQHLVRDFLRRMAQSDGAVELAAGAIGPVWQRLRSSYEGHAPRWERWLLGFVARRFLRRNRVVLSGALSQLGDGLATAAQAIVREALAQFYGRFQLVIARSDVYREKLIAELYLPAERVRTLRAGVDTHVFSPERTLADGELRERFGIPQGTHVVLYVGRVTDEKNVGFLADAWRAYREQNHGTKTVFAIVGSGNEQEFSRRAGPGVCALGPLHGAELSAAYRLADVFWTGSVNETLGQVVLEAQASGVPIVVTNHGAARENVRDGETGRVLAVDDPVRWARELHTILSDPERRVAMGRAARAYAEDHTIESSYRHFWALHEELLASITEDTSDRIRVAQAVASEGWGPASTHVSDYHAGKRSKRIPKEAALRAACVRAGDRRAKLFLHGDFLDTRPALHKFRADLDSVRRVLAEADVAPALYLEGNHDYEFGRNQKIDELIGCRVARSLIHYDAETGLVLTHGHVSELPGIQSLLKEIRSRDELIDALSVDRLKDRLELTAVQYDLVGLVTHVFEDAGLHGLEDVWRHSYDARRVLADALMKAARSRALDDHGVKALIHMIGATDREQVLSQLCAALGGWGLVYGHTHEPHVTKRQIVDPLTGEERTILLGNSGSFCRKTVPPTWIEAAFPCMELWAYNDAKKEPELLDRVSLRLDESIWYRGPYSVAVPNAAPAAVAS